MAHASTRYVSSIDHALYGCSAKVHGGDAGSSEHADGAAADGQPADEHAEPPPAGPGFPGAARRAADCTGP